MNLKSTYKVHSRQVVASCQVGLERASSNRGLSSQCSWWMLWLELRKLFTIWRSPPSPSITKPPYLASWVKFGPHIKVFSVNLSPDHEMWFCPNTCMASSSILQNRKAVNCVITTAEEWILHLEKSTSRNSSWMNRLLARRKLEKQTMSWIQVHDKHTNSRLQWRCVPVNPK